MKSRFFPPFGTCMDCSWPHVGLWCIYRGGINLVCCRKRDDNILKVKGGLPSLLLVKPPPSFFVCHVRCRLTFGFHNSSLFLAQKKKLFFPVTVTEGQFFSRSFSSSSLPRSWIFSRLLRRKNRLSRRDGLSRKIKLVSILDEGLWICFCERALFYSNLAHAQTKHGEKQKWQSQFFSWLHAGSNWRFSMPNNTGPVNKGSSSSSIGSSCVRPRRHRIIDYQLQRLRPNQREPRENLFHGPSLLFVPSSSFLFFSLEGITNKFFFLIPRINNRG